MTRRSVGRWAGLAMLVALSAPASPLRAQQVRVQAGVANSADSIRVGDPFTITVEIRAPRGATIAFPQSTDSTSTIQSLDRVLVRTLPDSSAVTQSATYRVAPWDVGEQRLTIASATVRVNGIAQDIPIVDSVFVRSVLPTDSTKRVPKPPRALFTFSVFPWWWVAAAIAAVILLLILWWWFRRRRTPAPAVAIDAFARAEEEFARIEALGLLEAGERARHVALMVEVLRDYLAARYSAASLALTSTELAHLRRELTHLPSDRLTRTLTDADLIKFARRPVSTERARELGLEMRAIVAEDHAAAQPAAATQAAA